VMAGNTLYFSHDGGQVWEANPVTIEGVTAVATPLDFALPLLVGLENGEVIQVTRSK